jgi:hypothetical protein
VPGNYSPFFAPAPHPSIKTSINVTICATLIAPQH